jgi:nifR3 family TIM-barrel protein
MVSAAALARENRRTLGYLQVPDLGPDLAVQLFGADPNELAEAARKAEDAGFQHVNLNMGCPVRKVVRSGAGSALMADPLRAEQCVRRMRSAVSGTLSVKLRAGWDSARVNCCDIARMAAEHGADLLILHPRTRAQGFSGKADWELVKHVVEAVAVPVIGNGDVESAGEAVERLRNCGCAGVMIGRAALARPWIFREAEVIIAGGGEPPPVGPLWIGDDLLLQTDHLVSCKGSRAALLEMRKFAGWAVRGMTGGADFRRRVQTCTDLDELKEVILSFFQRAQDLISEVQEGAA